MAVSMSLVNLAADTWTELTNADATTITVVHRGGAEVVLQATTGATPTASSVAGLPLAFNRTGVGDGWLKKTITELSHTALVDRVWAKAIGGTATLLVETD